MTIPKPPVLQDARLIDKAISGIQSLLVSELTWLETAYGIAQKVPKEIDGRVSLAPMIYTGGFGGDNYVSMFPDEHLKNYCWFDIDGLEQINQIDERGPLIFKAKLGIIFWCDLRNLYTVEATEQANNSRNVEAMVLEALKKNPATLRGMKILSIGRSPREVYPFYSVPQSSQTKMIRPYNNFRINIEISYSEYNCSQVGAVQAWINSQP